MSMTIIAAVAFLAFACALSAQPRATDYFPIANSQGETIGGQALFQEVLAKVDPLATSPDGVGVETDAPAKTAKAKKARKV